MDLINYHRYFSGEDSTNTYNKQWDETWFISNPEIFAVRHLPLTHAHQIDIKKQGIDIPYKDVTSWDSDLCYDAIAVACKLEPISYKKGVIVTHDNTAKLKFSSSIYGEAAFFYQSMEALSGKNVSNHVLLYSTSGRLVCDIRLPGAGDYILKIGLSDEAMNGKLRKNVRNMCYIFTIRGTGSESYEPYPKKQVWGPLPEMIVSGCRIVNYQGPVLTTKSGLVQVTIQLPVSGICPIWMQLHDKEGNAQSGQCVYVERQGQILTGHVACPRIGNFELSASAKFQKGNSYTPLARWMIVCESRAAEKDMFPDYSSPYPYGPHPNIIPLGLRVVSPLSSTILAKDGCATLLLMTERPLSIISKLFTSSGEVYDKYLSSINEETEGNKINIHLRIAKIGIYKLDIYAGENTCRTPQPVAYFLVRVERGWTGPQFIEHKGLWGITSPDISLSQPKCSTVIAKNGETVIELKCKGQMKLNHELKDLEGNIYDNKSSTVDVSWQEENLVSYRIKILDTGVYKLTLYGGNELLLRCVGNMMIRVDEGSVMKSPRVLSNPPISSHSRHQGAPSNPPISSHSRHQGAPSDPPIPTHSKHQGAPSNPPIPTHSRHQGATSNPPIPTHSRHQGATSNPLIPSRPRHQAGPSNSQTLSLPKHSRNTLSLPSIPTLPSVPRPTRIPSFQPLPPIQSSDALKSQKSNQS